MDPAVNFLAEAVDPEAGHWTVQESMPIDSCVDLIAKRANIPVARTRATEKIRLHELAHVAHSDANGAHHDTEQVNMLCRMLEEFRIDAILMQNGVNVQNRHDDFDMKELESKIPASPFWRLVYYLQTRFQAAGATTSPDVIAFWNKQRRELTPTIIAAAESAIKELAKDLTRETRCQEARKLGKLFEQPLAPPAKARVKLSVVEEFQRQEREERMQAQEKAKPKATKTVTVPVKKAPTPEEEEKKKEEDKKLAGGSGGFPKFGAAEIHDHLARNQKFTQVKAPFTRTGRGLIPEFMENYCIDKRIFRTDHRGGVLVLDTSGSMSPNWELIEKQMHQFPNLVVMSYSGVNGIVQRDRKVIGRICVHARAGRIDPHFGSEPGKSYGNDVDVEALEYGAKFKGPRIWVSDGMACGGVLEDGYGTSYGSPLQRKVQEVMKQHQYIRVGKLEDALAWVTQSGPIHYWTAGVLDIDKQSGANIDRRWGTTGPEHKYGRRSR